MGHGLLVSLLAIGSLAMRPAGAEQTAGEEEATEAASAADALGAELYRDQCASCHGEQGQGVDGAYDEPLLGDRSLRDLTEVIEGTMPEGDPEACSGEEAAAVAEYIYNAFYSRDARMRTEQARIELSRLTVDQYANTVADLLAGSRGQPRWTSDERGLRGYYNASKNVWNKNTLIERVDSLVEFDFGEGTPDDELFAPKEEEKEEEKDKKRKKKEPPQFSIRWQGSIFAPETGDYEFNIRTENAFRFYINDTSTAALDRWVRSGDEMDHPITVRLLGGRPYSIRLEYMRAQEETASVTLQWRPPHGIRQTIPTDFLSPQQVPETLIVETRFPPDDASAGFPRGTTVSRAWHQATTDAAIEVANKVSDDLPRWAGVKSDAEDREEKLREFCHRFVEGALRRTPEDQERQVYVDRQFEVAETLEEAVKRVLLLTLTSPRFLYLPPAAPAESEPEPHRVASILAYTLWDATPDEALRRAADEGKLSSSEQVEEQIRRMRDDPRTRTKLRGFFHHWLGTDHIGDLSKDSERFEGFTNEIADDLRRSIDLFIEDIVWSETSDFRQLIAADHLLLNDRLAAFYGIELPDAGDEAAATPHSRMFRRVSLDPQERAGVLTHPYLLSGFAYHADSSPIHRGVFLVRSVLGRTLRAPPDAVQPLADEEHAGLSMRELVTMQTKAASCQACHSVINPLGFALENYDAVGRFRTEDRNKPVDASGYYETLEGERVEFEGARPMADALVQSDEVHRTFVTQLFSYMVKQPIQAYGVETIDALHQSFVDSGFSVQHLLGEVARVAALPPPNQVLTTLTGESSP